MFYFKSIVLNVPHSSIENYNEGWTGKSFFFNMAKGNTDWHTDLVFSSRNPNVKMHRFPYSRFHVDVDRNLDEESEWCGGSVLYADFYGFKRHLTDDEKERLMGLYHNYMDELSADLNYSSLLITCKAFSTSRIRPYDVAIGFNEDDGSKPSDDTLNQIAHVFQDCGYWVEYDRLSSLITPTQPVFYRSISISINKRKYMDEKTLLLNQDECTKMNGCINKCYDLLLKA